MLIGHSVSDADGRIVSLDAAVCDAFGRPRSDIVGRSYLDLTHPADRRRNALIVRRLPSEAMPVTLRKRYLTPDGDTVETDVTVSRFGTGPDHGRLVGTLYRVAADDRRFAPNRLWAAARQLARLNDIRSDLLGTELFADYALSLLLHIYLDEAEGRRSELAALAGSIGVPLDGTARWLRALESKELIELLDGGRVAQLTGIGAQRIHALLTATLD